LDQVSLEAEGWTLSSSSELNITRKIQASGKRLEDIWPESVFYGVKTGCNAAFIVNEETYIRILSIDPGAKKVIKKCVRGRDVRKWKLDYQNKWLIFIPRGDSLDNYPGVSSYLKSFKEALEPKPSDWPAGKKWPGRKTGTYKWYELQDPVNYAAKFSDHKVVCPTLISEAKFAVDNSSFFGNDKTTIIVTNKPNVLACLLNSLPIWWQLTKIAQTRQNGYYEIKPTYLRRLIFPHLSHSDELQLDKLAHDAIKAVEISDVIKQREIEIQIDLFVAGLFKFNADEFDVIKKSLNESR
jgi:adenine-specific DNA-methyltransferase